MHVKVLSGYYQNNPPPRLQPPMPNNNSSINHELFPFPQPNPLPHPFPVLLQQVVVGKVLQHELEQGVQHEL